MTYQPEREKRECPRCGYHALVPISNMMVCNQCGGTFYHDKNPVATQAQRARQAGVGYKPRGGQ